MKKIAALIIIAVLAYAGARFYSSNRLETVEIVAGGYEFKAYVADREDLRQNGLSGFSPLEEDEAMLFVFPKPDTYGIWMKDMLFPIDIVWLDEGKKVVSIEKNVSPNTFPKAFYPDSPALYVIEFISGNTDKYEIGEGDQFIFQI